MGLPYLQKGARERKEDYGDILVGIGGGGNLLSGDAVTEEDKKRYSRSTRPEIRDQ
jgi:hypothetical protein